MPTGTRSAKPDARLRASRQCKDFVVAGLTFVGMIAAWIALVAWWIMTARVGPAATGQ